MMGYRIVVVSKDGVPCEAMNDMFVGDRFSHIDGSGNIREDSEDLRRTLSWVRDSMSSIPDSWYSEYDIDGIEARVSGGGYMDPGARRSDGLNINAIVGRSSVRRVNDEVGFRDVIMLGDAVCKASELGQRYSRLCPLESGVGYSVENIYVGGRASIHRFNDMDHNDFSCAMWMLDLDRFQLERELVLDRGHDRPAPPSYGQLVRMYYGDRDVEIDDNGLEHDGGLEL